MSLRKITLLSFWPAVAAALLASAGAAAAADGSISETVTNAFETVVIDAATAAKKAQELLKEKPFEKKKKKNEARKDQKDAEDGSTLKKGDAKDKRAPAASAEKSAPAKDTAAETKTTKDAKDKAAADGAASADAKTGKATETKPAETKPAESTPKKPAIATEWPAVDVELARARCTQLLKGVDAVTIPEPPFRKGDCGSMAPVRLVSIGKSPEIALSPPPVVSCDLVVALTKWMKNDVQPAARRHLGAEIIRVESMSDYSCRMAYGRIGNKLSEHGKANALDIRGFITRKGSEAVVLSGWGETARDVKKQMLVAKAAAEKAEAVKVAAEQASKERAEVAEYTAKAETTGTTLPRKTLVEGLPPKKDTGPSLALPASVTKDGPLNATRTRLGGPNQAVVTTDEKVPKGASKQKKAKTDATTTSALPGAEIEVAKPAPKTAESRFLHDVHASACRTFGTTLGPEANEAHRNHFHVDMAERKVRKICD